MKTNRKRNSSKSENENKIKKVKQEKKLILWIPPSSINHNYQILVKDLRLLTEYVGIFAPYTPIDSSTTLASITVNMKEYWSYCWLNEVILKSLLFFRHCNIILPKPIQHLILLSLIQSSFLNYTDNKQLRFTGSSYNSFIEWNREQVDLQNKKNNFKTKIKKN